MTRQNYKDNRLNEAAKHLSDAVNSLAECIALLHGEVGGLEKRIFQINHRLERLEYKDDE